MSTFGIHFGATNVYLAVCKDGKADIVANEAGDRATPAVVAFTDHDITVGIAAKQGLIRNSSNTICRVKELLGCNALDEDFQEVIDRNSTKITKEGSQLYYKVEHKGKSCNFTPENVATEIFKTMLKIGQHNVGNTSSNQVVLSVPIYYSEKRRHYFKLAAEKAGFRVLQIINEPCSSMLAYDIDQDNNHNLSHVVVVRCGGHSLDVCVVKVINGMYQILSSITSSNLSGKQISDIVVNHFASEFQKKWKVNCLENKRAAIKLFNASETCKQVLSNMPTANCSIDSLHDGIDGSFNLSRARFEGMCANSIQKIIDPVEEAIKQANCNPSDISKVILTGGTANIPLFKSSLEKYFTNAEILNTILPEEAIALGNAKQAALLACYDDKSQDLQQFQTEIPCISCDIFAEVSGEEIEKRFPIFNKGTPIPSRNHKKYTIKEEQINFLLNILTSNDNNSYIDLAQVCLKDVTPAGEIDTTFHLYGDGSLHVLCKDIVSEKIEDILIEAS